ncbi:protoporphyrinogen/coproporphyrinogen oxidase [Alloyangia pacifica]|uniref:Protoporphyrinogen oxidase n=1 Tax=Alloyangia pacifica TaxID=311180 RepID=A0A1I6T405_9RHOB|nr:FAD-dependent oxidoreductase [Alloyangia pacifica]SDG96820.1 Protoporphyrinogen oxidase [Alloyangia pacifica]SFS83916.1 Protoporphyrinogen oxidase [Alloyangia pacifica]
MDAHSLNAQKLTAEIPPPTSARVLILGGGIAGLTAADTLARLGHDVTVIEESETCGGVHRSREIGPYTFDAGSIFYEDNARLFGLAPGLRELSPPVRRIQRRISPEATLLHYPFEPRDLMKWKKLLLLRGLADMGWSRMRGARDGTLETACRTRLGRSIFEGTGLRSYMERFNHVPPAEVDESFFFHRMKFVEQATRTDAILRSALRALRRKPFRKGPPVPLRVRPASGFQTLFEPIQANLEARAVKFVMSQKVTGISGTPGNFTVTTNGGIYLADTVISAIPLPTIYELLFGEDSGLLALDMLTLFVSGVDIPKEAGNVLFNFHAEGRWKRATLYSRIYPERETGGREYFSAEVTLPPGKAADPEEAFADLCRHMTELGLIRDAKLEGHELVRNAYPFYPPGTVGKLEKALARVSECGIISVGRQGRFEYLPTSSGVIRRVGEELERADISSSALEAPAA